jgi:hypothetical protein
MIKNWMVYGLTFGLTLAVGSMAASEVRRRRDKKALKEEVRTWEDEGGRIPGATLAAETTPEIL